MEKEQAVRALFEISQWNSHGEIDYISVISISEAAEKLVPHSAHLPEDTGQDFLARALSPGQRRAHREGQEYFHLDIMKLDAFLRQYGVGRYREAHIRQQRLGGKAKTNRGRRSRRNSLMDSPVVRGVITVGALGLMAGGAYKGAAAFARAEEEEQREKAGQYQKWEAKKYQKEREEEAERLKQSRKAEQRRLSGPIPEREAEKWLASRMLHGGEPRYAPNLTLVTENGAKQFDGFQDAVFWLTQQPRGSFNLIGIQVDGQSVGGANLYDRWDPPKFRANRGRRTKTNRGQRRNPWKESLREKGKASPCKKCAGEGRISQYSHIQGGVCYACAGTGLWGPDWRSESKPERFTVLGQKVLVFRVKGNMYVLVREKDYNDPSWKGGTTLLRTSRGFSAPKTDVGHAGHMYVTQFAKNRDGSVSGLSVDDAESRQWGKTKYVAALQAPLYDHFRNKYGHQFQDVMEGNDRAKRSISDEWHQANRIMAVKLTDALNKHYKRKRR